MTDLKSAKCIPCQIGAPTLTDEEIEKYKPQVSNEWKLEEKPGEAKKIVREFQFKDFKESLAFVNKVGELAEKEGHHPNIFLYSWNKVRIKIWTHKIKGLHKNDFILASKIDSLFD